MKLVLNHGPSVVFAYPTGDIVLKGHGILNHIEDEQFAYIANNKDFKSWVDKGYIVINPNNTENNKIDFEEKEIDEQSERESKAQFDSLVLSFMASGVSQSEAEDLARAQLQEEYDKAIMAGDADAKKLRRASKVRK